MVCELKPVVGISSLDALAWQQRRGPCDTFSLSLLLLAQHCHKGLIRLLEDRGQTKQ